MDGLFDLYILINIFYLTASLKVSLVLNVHHGHILLGPYLTTSSGSKDMTRMTLLTTAGSSFLGPALL
jgi:hypothetical protein